MADSQVPWGLEALNGAVSTPAWRKKPSWYLVAAADKMIPPDAQRFMAKIYVSKPEAVAALIEQAANGASTSAR